MSSWIIPSISIMVCSTIILVITYSYLYYIEKKSFIGIWAIGWTVYLAAQVITLITISEVHSSALVTISIMFFLISSILILWGAYSFVGKNMPRWCSIVIILSIIWLISTTILKLPFKITNFPISIVLGTSTIWVGVIFLYYGEGRNYLNKILGTCFILWGIHKMDYTFLRNITWFAPWGYIISAGFSLMITIVFIFIYFEKVRAELIGVQEVLLASEKKLVTIIENQRDIIFELDNKGYIKFISPACFEILGYMPDELKEKPFIDFIGSNIWGQIKTSKPNGISFEKTWIKGDSSTIYTNIFCKPSFNSTNEFVGVFGSIHDVTENKLLNEAREYDKLKTEFFANLSHELRTPLNLILASTQLLETYNKKENEIKLKGKIEKTATIVKQNVFRLLRLINNLIDITKVDTGYFELQLRNHNIVNVVEEITLSVVEYIESKGISIEFDTDIEEKIIACDSEKIERIILNLLSNSVKFTKDAGSIIVKVSDGEEFVTISVKDTGIGIPKDKQEMIFERFRQVDKSLTRNSEGSGIGLSLVKSLVELHRGTIDIQSKYGFGSEFIILLPVTKVQENLVENRYESLDSRKIEIEFSDIY